MNDSAVEDAAELNECITEPHPTHTIALSFVIGAISIVGIAGNTLAVTSYINQYLRQSVFRHYLRALCMSDSVVLIAGLFLFVIPVINDYLPIHADTLTAVHVLIVVAYPVGMTAQTTSNWLIVLMTLLRLLGICLPFMTRNSTNARTANVLMFVTLFLAILYNVPRAFEMELQPCIISEAGTTAKMISLSPLRINSTLFQTVYYVGAYGFFICLGPVLSLLACNSFIAWRLAQEGSNKTIRAHYSQKLLNRTKPMSALLAVVSCLHLICNSVPLAANIYELLLNDGADIRVLALLSSMGNLAICLQSSLNYFIHLMFSGRFRQDQNRKFSIINEGDIPSTAFTAGARCSIAQESPLVRIKKFERSDTMPVRLTQRTVQFSPDVDKLRSRCSTLANGFITQSPIVCTSKPSRNEMRSRISSQKWSI